MELPLLDATEQASFTALSLSLYLLILGQLLHCCFCAILCSRVKSPDSASLITRFEFPIRASRPSTTDGESQPFSYGFYLIFHCNNTHPTLLIQAQILSWRIRTML